MKARRQAKILELISQSEIDTQEELLRRLREAGFAVTQATVSRDMRELKLMKAVSPSGKYRYTAGREENPDLSEKLKTMLHDTAVSVASAGNLVVLKTHTGMAQAVCVALDAAHWEAVVGTLAGDDTIFAATHSAEAAQQLAARLSKMMG